MPKGMVLIVDSTSQGKTIPSKDTFSIQFLSSFISKGNAGSTPARDKKQARYAH